MHVTSFTDKQVPISTSNTFIPGHFSIALHLVLKCLFILQTLPPFPAVMPQLCAIIPTISQCLECCCTSPHSNIPNSSIFPFYPVCCPDTIHVAAIRDLTSRLLNWRGQMAAIGKPQHHAVWRFKTQGPCKA